jgi:hypothetical protein
MTTSGLPEIYNFHGIRDRLGTAGQPTEAQFRAVREVGFDVVINPALPTSPNALANEGSIVRGRVRSVSLRQVWADRGSLRRAHRHQFCRPVDSNTGRSHPDGFPDSAGNLSAPERVDSGTHPRLARKPYLTICFTVSEFPADGIDWDESPIGVDRRLSHTGGVSENRFAPSAEADSKHHSARTNN